MEKKRLTAKKAGLSELVTGKYVKKAGFESSYVLTSLGRRLSRVRILGLVVDKFESEDGKYATMTLDDGTETMRCKAFINISMFDVAKKGELVDLIGKIREYNGEIYVAPETVRKVPADWETLRALELKKTWAEQRGVIKKIRDLQKQSADRTELKALAKKFNIDAEDVDGILEADEMHIIEEEKRIAADGEVKEKVLRLISSLDTGAGADYSDILKQSGISENQVDAAVQDLLESGVCFEPKAGKIKKL
jgi:RPA family protein